MSTPAVRQRLAESPRRSDPSRCVVCGPEHPTGLRIRFRREAEGRSSAEWTPTDEWEGFPRIVHGGIVSTVLDEAMSQAVAGTGCQALTAELRVRYRRHVEPGERLTIRGWVVERRKRLIHTEAILTDAQGTEKAHAWGSFLAVAAGETR